MDGQPEAGASSEGRRGERSERGERGERGERTQHARLAGELREAILDGTYPVGGRLPTESALCESHGLSRGTVRVALRTLEDQGLITRRPGAGTTVVSRQPVEEYLPLVTNRDQLIALYRDTGVVRPDTRHVRVDAGLAAHTGLPEGSEWTVLEGVRRSRRDPSGPPLCWTEQYLPPSDPPYDPDLAASHTAAMPPHRIEQTVRAVAMPGRYAAVLGATPGSPALVIGRRHLDADDRVVSASFHTHSGDRFVLSNVLVPEE
ncbi:MULTISPECIES: GntR family transcriptional regulator [unclassified Nocardioides]|uniref:GntR family transcriptional regulator n=1 Tax=unclassified Nocardioides TaxID=2615069 RepID=UPI001297E165|nr:MULTISPECIES: GntR family transcriptional regulator [unclassified Nocardioides]